ncbi:MAG: phospho-sugar mutase [Actinobacteria bacterium]|nr:MAG: phospho-sugar mutase [Actinomycetota bacterium]
MTDILGTTRAWIDGDPDPVTRAELSRLIDTGSLGELEDRMNGSLVFGTAGLRGVVEGGSNRMNRATVIRTTAGLAAYLVATTDPMDRLVAIGRDARPSSQSFMDDTIGVLTASGFAVRYFRDPTPTPLVAFAGLSMGACATIVITASHNPPADNGYKVYAGNGAQIIPPMDLDVAGRISEVGAANMVPRAADPYTDPDVLPIGPELFEDYLISVAATLPSATRDRTISIVYTPMHGVGGGSVMAALARFGFKHVHPVARQFAPDGTFPTVSFPNPEEPGALDLAHELAQALDADLVLANDPDTDRLAVSLPMPGGVWRPLTGNQIGCLLAEYLLGHGERVERTAINSIVSTPMLGDIAAAHGATWQQSLTGFKWIWNAALELEDEGKGSLVLGFEEALGYSVGTTVRDKDGISAAVAFATLAAEAAADGSIVLDRLGDLYRRYGIWVSTQMSIRREGPAAGDDIAEAMAELRSEPPASIAGIAVESVTDFLIDVNERPRYLGSTNLIELDLGDLGRVLARPSGTEPKLKIYVDLTSPFPADGAWQRAEDSLSARAKQVGESLHSWLENTMTVSGAD